MDESLKIASKNWDNIVNSASKIGYSNGVLDGSNEVFQEGFDIGYKEAFNSAFTVGIYKSCLTKLPKNHPDNIRDIIKKINQEECYICVNNLEDELNLSSMNLENIIEEQRKLSVKTIKELHQYFEPFMKQQGIDISTFNSSS
ncbi:uncharacterized protein [Prorops nasuta]|uniref:uncharacterized protein n=1 Tax=Prorops nasuta TaxID=863751 RepID=UPI0034CD28B3